MPVNSTDKIILQIYKVLNASPTTFLFPQHVDVFVAIAQLTCDKDVSIANKAILITSNLPQEAYPKVLEEMKIALDYNSSSKCNVLEVRLYIYCNHYN